MGDILGFFIFAALAVTQPQLFRKLWKYSGGWLTKIRKYTPDAFRILGSWTSEKFLTLAVLLGILEGVYVYYAPESLRILNRWTLLIFFMTFGQVFLAAWNLFWGLGKVETLKISDGQPLTNEEVLRDPVNEAYRPENTRKVWQYWAFDGKWRRWPVISMILAPHPFIWLTAIAFAWLLQGAKLQHYALVYANDYSDQMWIVFYGWLSKVVYGIIALTASGILSFLIIKTTRAVEGVSTLLAKMVISIAPNIEFNKNALQELGGPIDILDEERLSSFLAYLMTILFIPLLIFDVIIFVWPSIPIAIAVLLGITVGGMMEWSYGRMGKDQAAEGYKDRVNRMRVIFKMLPSCSVMGFLFFAFLYQTIAGKNFQIQIDNYWTGLAFHAYWSPLVYWLIGVPFGLIAGYYLKKVWKFTAESVERKEKLPETDGWGKIPMRFGVWILLGATGFSFVLAFTFGLFGCVSCFGGEQLRFHPTYDQDALVFQDLTVNGQPVTARNPDGTWDLGQPNPERVRVEFNTAGPAYGVVEFSSIEAAEEAHIPAFVNVVSDRNKAVKTEGARRQGLYHHVAQFNVPRNFSGKYQLLMRNAQKKVEKPGVPKPDLSNPDDVMDNELYGRVATSAWYDRTLPEPPPFYEGWWTSVKNWWHDLWNSDESDKPDRKERTATTSESGGHRPIVRSTRYSSDCTGGCAEPPLEVDPYYRRLMADKNR